MRETQYIKLEIELAQTLTADMDIRTITIPIFHMFKYLTTDMEILTHLEMKPQCLR